MNRSASSFPCVVRHRAGLRSSVLLAVLLLPLLLGGCWPLAEGRNEKIARIARWEDRRLAPTDSLVARLDDGDAHVRLAAVRAAGLIGRNDVLPQLLSIVADDPSSTVRAEAAFALGLLGDERAVPALAEAVETSHTDVQLAALAGLAQLPSDGQVLLRVAASGSPDLAAAAWDALRNQSAGVDRGQLLAVIQGGLTRPEADVQWRVLRCAEVVPDSSLTASILPFAQSAQAQVRVHAYRALSRLDSRTALAAVTEGFSSHERFKGRQRDRVIVAGCRALGALAPLLLEQTGPGSSGTSEDEHAADGVAALLIEAAGSDNPSVSATALGAMARATTDLVLPDEAAAQESLLPVWRIRLARAARSSLESSHVGVRAAALDAYAAVRGAGAAAELANALLAETVPQVAAAGLHAVSRHHPDPVLLLSRFAGPAPQRRFGEAAPRAGFVSRTGEAALEGLAHVQLHRPEVLPDGLPPDHVERVLIGATGSSDFAIATTAAGLLGDFPSDPSLEALCDCWDRAAGPGRFDQRRGVLRGLQALLTTDNSQPRAAGFADSLCARAAALLQAGFDEPDLRIRRESRAAALATGLLAEHLIPTDASLLATLPPVHRDGEQPPVALPGDAPSVVCHTDRGDFTIDLDGHLAPNTCAVFVDLVEQGFYEGLTFHRVVPDFVIQGGDPRGDGWGGPGYSIRSEWSRAPFRRGTVGIAHDGKDTGGSQFFVTLSEQPHLNGRYTVFGKVSRGLDVIDHIEPGDTMRLEVVR